MTGPTDSSSPRGHRIVGHTADLIVEAWAPTRAACLEEGAIALVTSFCDARDVSASETVAVSIEADSDLDLLVQFLEEIIYLVEVLGVVPITTRVEETENAGIAGFFEVVPVGATESTGAVPKGVSHHELAFEHDGDRWSCHAVVDV